MKQLLSILVFTALLIPIDSYAAGSAVMTLDATEYKVKRGEQFDVIVSVEPNNEALDTVRAVVTFDPNVLSAQNVSLVGTFDRSTPGNHRDNASGKISWGGFTLEGPIKSKTEFARITFMALAVGNAQITISTDSRAIADGEEKIDTSKLSSATVNVEPAASSQEGTALVVVESDSHSNEVDWYQNKEVKLSWTQLQGDSPVKAYYYSFDTTSDSQPATYLKADTTELTIKDVKDGVHYFHIKGVQENGKETPIVHRRVNIDATVPNSIELVAQETQILEGESAWFTFATTDETSGVVRYEIAINNSAFQIQESPLEMTDLQPGTYFFKVSAIDRAGNAIYGGTSVRVYPEGTDLSRPEGYVSTSEIDAITKTISKAVTGSSNTIKISVGLILGALVVIGIGVITRKKIK